MLQAKARWRIGEEDTQAAEKLVEALDLSPLLARMLVVRGITDIEQAAKFLHGGTDQTYDPFLLDGMAKAVERIRLAIDNGECIRIYGDYDADGVSSTTLMVYLLRQMDCKFDYYIPHRVHEGYGLNRTAIAAAKEQGITLMITVDTGVSAVEEIAYAHSLGIDVIVTDHHEPPEVLPDAFAILNPKKPGCPYPFKQLAGVGVALKLAQALLGRWPEELVEYAVIGTVADLMPLTDENRIIVKQGLAQLRSTSNLGIRALLEVAGIPIREVNSTHIGFAVAPRINASGRLLSADAAVRLLTTTDKQEAEQLAAGLDELNKERQRLVEETTNHALSMINDRQELGDLPKVLVLAHESWNVGVIGIVASKIVERWYRPVIILGIDKNTGMAKGSARSIEGFDMYKALTHCHDLMDHFGGHQMAAGMTLPEECLPELERRLSLLAEEWLRAEDWIPLLKADLPCDFSDIAIETIRQLEVLGPFGMGNPSPRFLLSGLTLNEMRTMGKVHQHLKLSLIGSSDETAAAVDAVGFGKGPLGDWISLSSKLDVLGELTVNEWNGVRRPQIMIKDVCIPEVQLFDWRGTPKPERKLAELCDRLKLRESSHNNGVSSAQLAVVHFGLVIPDTLLQIGDHEFALWGVDLHGRMHPCNEYARELSFAKAQDVFFYSLPDRLEQLDAVVDQTDLVERYYAAFGGSEEDKQAGRIPDRNKFKLVYGSVKTINENAAAFKDIGDFIQGVSKRSGLSPGVIAFILDVFTEIGLVKKGSGDYRLIPVPDKKDLSASLLYQSRMKRPETEQELLYTTARDLISRLLARKTQKHAMMEEIV